MGELRGSQRDIAFARVRDPVRDVFRRSGLLDQLGQDHLFLTVEDDGLGAALPLRPGLGVGNTRERLVALYGERAALDIDTAPDAGFRARIQIPVHEARP